MPEYLAPGVYVEETSFRSKSIEGVPTSTTGFVGQTRFGPLHFTDGPTSSTPRLITSFTEFERVYGGLAPLVQDGQEVEPYLAHAARAFFANGGKRLYVSRVFGNDSAVADQNVRYGLANAGVPVVGAAGPQATATWRARWPGADGNAYVEVKATRTKNLAFAHAVWGTQVRGAKRGAVVEVWPAGTPAANLPKEDTALTTAQLFVVNVDADGKQTFVNAMGAEGALPGPTPLVFLVELRVRVSVGTDRVDVYDALATDPRQPRFIGRILERNDPEDENAAIWLDWAKPALNAEGFNAAFLAVALQTQGSKRLTGGHDGLPLTPSDLEGKAADPDVAKEKATGLEALAEIDDIAIVAAPDAGSLDEDSARLAADALITHAERCRYRIAVVDGRQGSSISEIRNFRGRFDSKYAALYHPWIEVLDPLSRPTQGAPQRRIMLPPSGFVCGIYARSDIERGVHKAPANEVVRGLTRFEININKARQDVLNPEGVNCLRFFEGRGNRVWGARTMSSDPEWKYVNVRRLFIYIEHSIDKATQWAVFEPNNDRLWSNIRRTVEDFLYVLWRDGALLGQRPEDAYFVRCDRSTMTQNDLDNGRMICLIGVAPVRPAEFVIFRVGQFTADRK